jgi:hypothetical protein
MAESRKDADFSQGWGTAAFIVALAVGAFVVAGTIKKNTFHAPRDPTAPSQGRAEVRADAPVAAAAGKR